MNIKQISVTIAAALARISKGKSRIYYAFSCFQGHCPTSDELENSKIKSLANRLTAGSYEETLTSILEWQDRNIEFWTERHPIHTILYYICLTFGVAFIIGFSILIFLVIRNIQLLPWLSWFNVIWFVMLVSSIVTTLTIMIWIIHSNRKIPVKEGLKNVFMPSISMNALLEKRLGVCRDYAKLTACLLSNIYPDAAIYFAYAPGHTATGIVVENKLYMLDQRLPILTIDRWNNYRHLKKIERFDWAKKSLKSVDINSFLSPTKTTSLHLEKLGTTMTKLLDIRKQTDNKAISLLEIPWKKGAILYEDDDMVNYSLARRLKTKISNELMEMNRITRIEITRHKDDIMFLIRFT